MLRALLLSFALGIFILGAQAQELRCNIQVVHRQIKSANEQVFETLRKDLYEFLNNTKWTNHVYDNDERIECNFQINVVEMSGSSTFMATLQVQSTRPIYGTNYYSPLLNYKEKEQGFQFEYMESEPLEFNENSHSSNLVATLAFYVYVVLGLDYDSFSPEGGAEYFAKAQKIVNNAQSSPESNWKSYERYNRYWLLENLTNERFDGVHTFLYQYHRQGLDLMHEDPITGRANIAKSLEELKKVHQRKPNSMIMRCITAAKTDEYLNIFSEGPMDERRRVFNILKDVDPANTTKYEGLVKNNE